MLNHEPSSSAPAVMPRCSIVIRSYNEENHLGRLLEGITHQAIKDEVEIILVDSGSTDATLSIASRYPVQVVHIPPQEFTFGRSLNLGIQQARAALLVFASAHVYPVYPDWLEKLLVPFADPQVGLVYGKQRGAESTCFSEHQVFAHWFPDHSTARQATPFCNNANAAIRRSLWVQRPYDETLPGLEDLDWAHWAMGQGHQIAYSAEAEIIHVHNETPHGVFNRYRREAMAFHRIFPQERFRLVDFFRLAATNIASDLWHAGMKTSWKQPVLWRSAGSIFWFRWMQFWGTYQGYRHTGPLTWHLRQTFYYPRGLTSSGGENQRSVEPIQYS